MCGTTAPRPADVAPNQWVFDHPFFLLLNLAVGGNFGGAVGPDTVFPATMLVDYVRVYRGPDTSERFEATFTDNSSGWQEVKLPFGGFTRSATQPAGAPNDGFTRTDVWGYTFRLPDNGMATGSLLLDGIGLVKPASVVVTSPANAGPGSLRRAVDAVADNGTVTFDPSLAGATIRLQGPLVISGKTVTIRGLAAPGLRVSGGGTTRVFIIDPGARLNVRDLTIADGFGFELAGGVLNNGTLDMDHCVVANNLVTTSGVDFWKGGAGVYNGAGSTFRLTNSTVRNNTTTGADGGGIYAFFGATVEIENSTVSGNVASNVGGGIRMLGNATLRNSTLSGNSSLGWHGSAVFHTDGVMNLVNTTVTGNVAPPGTAAVFVGTFTAASATLNTLNSIVAGNSGDGCFLAPFGSGTVALNSLGNNVFSDGSCFAVGSDVIEGGPLLGPLADNGGPTLTHLPLPGSRRHRRRQRGAVPGNRPARGAKAARPRVRRGRGRTGTVTDGERGRRDVVNEIRSRTGGSCARATTPDLIRRGGGGAHGTTTVPRRPRRGNVDDEDGRWRIPRGRPARRRGRWRVGVPRHHGAAASSMPRRRQPQSGVPRARPGTWPASRSRLSRSLVSGLHVEGAQRPRCGPGARPQPRDRARRCASGDRGREHARAAGRA